MLADKPRLSKDWNRKKPSVRSHLKNRSAKQRTDLEGPHPFPTTKTTQAQIAITDDDSEG